MILYEDPEVLAVNKPAGAVVIPARGEPPERSLKHSLEALRGERLWVVHRIDRDTSGVLLFARNAEAHRRINHLFAARQVSKTYLAITRGAPPSERGVISVALHPARKGKMRPANPGEPGAMASRTVYEVLARRDTPSGPLTLLRCLPETGRQHQVRVHLRSLGCPLLVDPLYGRAAEVRGEELGVNQELVLSRLSLHASSIQLPWGSGTLRVEAPLAQDLKALIEALFADFDIARIPVDR